MMTIKRIFLSLLIIFATAVPVMAEHPLQPIMEQVRKQYNLPAIGAISIIDGQIGEPCVVGVVGNGMKKTVPADARWHLGSCGKSMTALLTAIMVERGDLRWDTTLGEALADSNIQIHADYLGVTIEQLLRHRGGLPGNLGELPVWIPLRLKGGPAKMQRRMIAQACLANAPANPPGSTYVYANEGYVIVGHILERIARKPFETLMKEHVFTPLGMTSAGFGPPRGKADPRGHLGDKPLPPNRMADNPEGLSPAGRMHMSLNDWARYAQAHLRAARGEAFELVSEETFRYLHTPLEGHDYALGWICTERGWSDGPVLVHGGSNTMWFAELWIAPKRNAAFLAVTNSAAESAHPALQEVIKAMIGSLEPAQAADPAAPQPASGGA